MEDGKYSEKGIGSHAGALLPSVHVYSPARIDTEDGDGGDRSGGLSVGVGGTEGYQGGGSNRVYGEAFDEKWGDE